LKLSFNLPLAKTKTNFSKTFFPSGEKSFFVAFGLCFCSLALGFAGSFLGGKRLIYSLLGIAKKNQKLSGEKLKTVDGAYKFFY
jgi:hypothetical protein